MTFRTVAIAILMLFNFKACDELMHAMPHTDASYAVKVIIILVWLALWAFIWAITDTSKWRR